MILAVWMSIENFERLFNTLTECQSLRLSVAKMNR
jgi:hypothetical protein